MVLGFARDPVSRDPLRARGAARGRKIARIRFAKIAAATFRDGGPFTPRFAVRLPDPRARVRDREPGAAAMGLHLPGCEAKGARSSFRGGYFAEHAFERRAAEP